MGWVYEVYGRRGRGPVSFTLLDFHTFIKDKREPELVRQGDEVLKELAAKIKKRGLTPLSFLLPFEVWPKSKERSNW